MNKHNITEALCAFGSFILLLALFSYMAITWINTL